jgi:ribosome maturation factor RimP
VEINYRFEGGRVVLRLLVDTASGVTLDELSGLNRSIGALLDEHDVIPERYVLEVSSPGLDRPLKTPADFERVIGRRLKVNLTVPLNDRQEYAGELLNANEEAIVLKMDTGDKLRILLADIARAVQEVRI